MRIVSTFGADAARLLVVGLGVVVLACGDSTAPRAFEGLRVVRGGSQTDTILAMAAPLVVEVRDSRATPVAGARVVFAAQPANPADSGSWRRPMYVCATTASPCASVSFVDQRVSVADTVATDSQGQAAAGVQFGVVAGAGAVRVTVPSLGIDTLVTYTTRPGRFAYILVAGRDTAVYPGTSYPIDARATDAFNNTRSDRVTVTSATPGVVTVTNGTVNAVDFGLGRIAVAAAGLADTVAVTVVPPGRLVAFGMDQWGQIYNELTVLGTDGSGRRVLLTNNSAAMPIWLPGSRIVYQTPAPQQTSASLQLIDTLGNAARLLGPDFGYAIEAAYASKADKVYFFGTYGPTNVRGLYVANGDGSSPTYLLDGVQPAPSPDGLQLAYVNLSTLNVRDMTSGKVRAVAQNPTFPRWSPTADVIAFMGQDASISVVNADGTGLRKVSTSTHEGRLAWSPDGAWIVAKRFVKGLELIRVSDGLILPIPGTLGLIDPDWE